MGNYNGRQVQPDLEELEFDSNGRLKVTEANIDVSEFSGFPIVNSELKNSSLDVAGNNVSLGDSTGIKYVDLSDTGISFPIPNSDIENSSVEIAGNNVSLGDSVSIASTDLSDSNNIDAQTLQGNQPSDLKSKLGKNVSLSEYRSEVNRSIRNDARQNFELGLIKLSYPDGFYDIFVDESKIASKSGSANFDSSNNLINLINISNKVERGADDGSAAEDQITGLKINPNQNLTNLKCRISSNVSNATKFYVIDDSGSVLVEKTGEFNGGDVITLSGTFNSGNNYYIGVDADDNVYTRGNFGGPTYPYTSTLFDITGAFFYDPPGDSSPNDTTAAAFSILSITAFEIGTSGTVTSTVKDLGYSASKWTPTADYELNGQSIDYLELQDGSGNQIKRITDLSRLGDAISISTSATSYHQEISLSGDGTDTPVINSYESGLDDAE